MASMKLRRLSGVASDQLNELSGAALFTDGFDDFAGLALGTIGGLEAGFGFGLSDDAGLGL